MSGSPHETTAEAAELCRVKAIRVVIFFICCSSSQKLLLKPPIACSRIPGGAEQFCRLALPNTVAGRLASLLLEWLDAPRARPPDDRRFIVALTQEEIASMTNTSRETVSRVLHQFQQDFLRIIHAQDAWMAEFHVASGCRSYGAHIHILIPRVVPMPEVEGSLPRPL